MKQIKREPASLVLPFMTAVAGHVLVHDGETGATIEGFRGICTSASVTEFWRIYTWRGEAAYSKLYAWNIEEARFEARYLRIIRLLRSDGIGFHVVYKGLSGQLGEETRVRLLRRVSALRHMRPIAA